MHFRKLGHSYVCMTWMMESLHRSVSIKIFISQSLLSMWFLCYTQHGEVAVKEWQHLRCEVSWFSDSLHPSAYCANLQPIQEFLSFDLNWLNKIKTAQQICDELPTDGLLMMTQYQFSNTCSDWLLITAGASPLLACCMFCSTLTYLQCEACFCLLYQAWQMTSTYKSFIVMTFQLACVIKCARAYVHEFSDSIIYVTKNAMQSQYYSVITCTPRLFCDCL